jgi:hypothetical protein
MLLFITDVKEILIIISVFCILSFQDSVFSSGTNTETPADIDLLNTRYEPDMQKDLLEMQNKKQAICLASTRNTVAKNKQQV